jgi:hypothetical protein
MNIGSWIHNNVLRSTADFAALPTGPDPEEQDMEQGLDRLGSQVDKLREPVNVSVQGGYNNLQMKDKLILGASGGAVVGGALGAAKGFLGASAPFTVDPHWETHAINTQSVTFDQSRLQIPGTTQVATSNGLQDVNVPNAAIRYHFDPKVETKQVGDYKTPGSVDTHHPFTTNSLVGAAEGAAVGALGGVALTAGFVLVQHLRGKDQPSGQPTENVSFGDEKKTIAKTAALGAAVGGGIGALDGLLEHARAGATQTIEWDTPVYQHTTIGQVPQDASIIVRSDVRYANDAFNDSKLYHSPSQFNLEDYLKHGPKVDVSGDVPEKHILGIGGYKMEHHTQTYTSEARYGVGTTVVGGIVLGGLVGVAAGVAINVIRKVVNS